MFGLNYCVVALQIKLSNAVNFFVNTLVGAGDSVNVKELLGNEGAAGSGGALEDVSKQVNAYGGGAFHIVRNGVIFALGICMVGGAGLMAVQAGNASKREDHKTAMLWRFLCAVLAFGGIAILLFAQKIGEALFQ